MSTTPPEQPPAPPGGTSRPTITMPSIPSGAQMPVPGNAEFLLWVVVESIFVIIWISAESVNTFTWVAVTTVLTSFYFLSRGIAKASRVLEQ
jgi:hypothetical protein